MIIPGDEDIQRSRLTDRNLLDKFLSGRYHELFILQPEIARTRGGLREALRTGGGRLLRHTCRDGERHRSHRTFHRGGGPTMSQHAGVVTWRFYRDDGTVLLPGFVKVKQFPGAGRRVDRTRLVGRFQM